jgi:hypothetical protein
VVDVGSPFTVAIIASVVAVPLALTVTALAHAPDAIAEVPIAAVPDAIVCVKVTLAGMLVPLMLVEELSAVAIFAAGSTPLTSVVKTTAPQAPAPCNTVVLLQVPLQSP